MVKTIVVGGDGTLGTALVKRLEIQGVPYIATSRHAKAAQDSRRIAFDLSTAGEPGDVGMLQLEAAMEPASVVLILAAITTFAACRENPELSEQVNVRTPCAIATVARRSGARTVFVSSSAVFAGTFPLIPSDYPRDGNSHYGRQKAAAEETLLGTADTAVVRPTKILSPGAPLFTRWQKALAAGESVSAFTDMRLAPVPLPAAVEFLLGFVDRFEPGTFQLSGSRDASYFELARHLATVSGVPAERVVASRASESGVPPEQIGRFASLQVTEKETARGFVAPDPIDVVDWSLTKLS